jgi:hypothetical protein
LVNDVCAADLGAFARVPRAPLLRSVVVVLAEEPPLRAGHDRRLTPALCGCALVLNVAGEFLFFFAFGEDLALLAFQALDLGLQLVDALLEPVGLGGEIRNAGVLRAPMPERFPDGFCIVLTS